MKHILTTILIVTGFLCVEPGQVLGAERTSLAKLGSARQAIDGPTLEVAKLLASDGAALDFLGVAQAPFLSPERRQ